MTVGDQTPESPTERLAWAGQSRVHREDTLFERPGTTSAVDIWRITGLLRRQWRLIAATAFAIISIVAIIAFSLTPSYTTSTLLLVDPGDKNLLQPITTSPDSLGSSARVDSEVEILRSDGVLMDVIAAKELVKDPEFGVKLGLRDKLLAIFRNGTGEMPTGPRSLGLVLRKFERAVSVERLGSTYVIAVSVRSQSPEKAAELANGVASAYIQRQVQSKVQATLAARDTIQRQLEKAREAVIRGERAFNDYITDNIDNLATLTGRSDLADIRDTIATLTSQSGQTNEQIASLRDQLNAGDWSALAASLANDAARELARQREAILSRVEGAAEDSELTVNLRQELAKIDESLASATRERVSQLEGAVASDQARLAQARQDLNTAVSQADLPADVLARIYELQQISRNSTANYQSLLGRIQDLDTEALLQVADTRIVSPALTPSDPSFPRIPVILAFAAMLAIAAGLGVAFVLENYIGGFVSGEQIAAVTGHAMITSLPRQQTDLDSRTLADNLVTHPLSRYSEGIRRLRATIERAPFRRKRLSDRSQVKKATVVLVSSALSGEGKTTVALSLARAYALAGLRAVIIDCDLRKPTVHKHLKVEPSTGFIDFLRETLPQEKLVSIVVRDSQTSLMAVVGARSAEAPTDQLLSTDAFSRLLTAVSNTFDIVILDSPPVGPVVDGLYIAEYADVIAFVVRWAKTPQRAVVDALRSLSSSKAGAADILIIMNQDPGDDRSYGSDYGGYHVG